LRQRQFLSPKIGKNWQKSPKILIITQVKLADLRELDTLMNEEAYETYIKEQEH
jgi:hypothetical protein